jgi:hypothetical protein
MVADSHHFDKEQVGVSDPDPYQSEKSDLADPDPHINVMRSATLTDKIKYFEEHDLRTFLS